MDDVQTPARLTGVTKRYGAITALDGIDVALNAGETARIARDRGWL